MADRAMTTDAAYLASIEDWHAKRFAHLTAEDGWLNVIGRFWLEPGVATIGAAEDNEFVLSAGPAHLGSISLDGDEAIFTQVEPGGPPIRLKPDERNRPRFSLGTLRFEITSMDGRHALRVRDSEAPARHDFKGVGYFPTDPAWRKPAERIALEQPVTFELDTVFGIPTTVTVTHKAVLTHEGTRYELLPTDGSPERPMFVLRDLTSRSESYSAARFLYGEEVTDDSMILDFNKAYNPPCAFTIHAACPLPPPGNVLPIRIEAGELAPG